MSMITEVEAEEAEISKIDVNLSGADWRINGRVRFLVRGFVQDEGTIAIQHALDGTESEMRMGGTSFVIEVPFEDAASKGDALTKAAVQARMIAQAFADLAGSYLPDGQNAAAVAGKR